MMSKRQDPAARRLDSAEKGGHAIAVALLVLAVCLLATFAFWYQVRVESDRARRDAFRIRAEETLRHVEERLAALEQLLRGAAALPAVSRTLARSEFRAYLDSLLLGKHFPEIRGVGLAVLVEEENLARLVGQMRAEGVIDFQVRPEGNRPSYAPILFLERPADVTGLSLGFDMLTDPARHDAMDRARDGAALAMTGMIPLKRAPNDPGSPGFSLYMPFYEVRAFGNAAGPRGRASGWLFTQVCMYEMMTVIMGQDFGDSGARFEVRVYDSTDAPRRQLLYGIAPAQGGSTPAGSGDIAWTGRLVFGGRQWDMELRAPPGFATWREDQHPLYLTLAGVACSLLLATLSWLLATGRVRARRAASSMNEELLQSERRLRELNENLERRVAEGTRDARLVAERLGLAVAASGTGLWDWNLVAGEVHYSPEWSRQVGYEPDEIGGSIEAWENLLHPADRERAIASLNEHLRKPGAPFEAEYRLLHRDGTYRTMLARAQAFADASGNAVRVVGSHLDITDRKRAEDALVNLTRELRLMGRQLTKVEEADRRWLASELHDSIGSALTALNLNLTIIRDRLPEEARAALEPRLNDSMALLEETVETIRGLMAQLRPPVLDDYGLATALRWYVEQVAARADLDATFKLSGEDVRFPPEMEIALFRVVQGALTNVIKHADARRVAVTMDIAAGSVTIVIEDNGRGFLLETTHEDMESPHWGLLTMRERAAAIGGRCTIETSPGRGTRVTVEVPR